MKLLNHVVQLALISLLLVTTNTYAESWNCRHDDLVREVVINYPEGGAVPCQVVYKKQTEGFEDQTLWTAENQQGYCEEKAREFVEKLGSWGWTCMETVENAGGE